MITWKPVLVICVSLILIAKSHGSLQTRKASKISLAPNLGVEVEKFSSVDKEVPEESISHFACQLVRIIQILQHPDCVPKAIESFACSGTCPSYVQLSGSSNWMDYERSCTCCQQTRLQESTFTLDCPALDPPYRMVKTFSPVDCLCRACDTAIPKELKPQELAEE